MISSMTGFARLEQSGSYGQLTCEVRSVNHRYLEPGFRLPEELRALESELRQTLARELRRGKVDCTIHLRGSHEAERELLVDDEAVDRLLARSRDITERAAAKGLGASHLSSIDPIEVGRAIVASATPYRGEFQEECIGGILNPMGALEMVESGSVPAPFGTDTVKVDNPRSAPGLPPRSRANWRGKEPRGVEQSANEVDAVEQSLRTPTFVFALGSVGFEIPTDLAYEALEQDRKSVGIEGSVADAAVMGRLLAERPSLAERLTWLLQANGNPIYALEPEGPLAAEIYSNLAEILTAQVLGEVDTISIPGLRLSSMRTLRDGTRVPRVVMEVMRGLYAWTVESSVARTGIDVESSEILLSILRKIKDESRNDGAGGPYRTLNYLLANPVQLTMSAVIAQREGFTFGGLNIIRSTFSRPYSECWDIELAFVDTENEFRAGLIHRHTVDVADILPVSVGTLKTWRA